jgi:hypothetical protein
MNLWIGGHDCMWHNNSEDPSLETKIKSAPQQNFIKHVKPTYKWTDEHKQAIMHFPIHFVQTTNTNTHHTCLRFLPDEWVPKHLSKLAGSEREMRTFPAQRPDALLQS